MSWNKYFKGLITALVIVIAVLTAMLCGAGTVSMQTGFTVAGIMYAIIGSVGIVKLIIEIKSQDVPPDEEAQFEKTLQVDNITDMEDMQ